MAQGLIKHKHFRKILLSSFGGSLELYDFLVFTMFVLSIGKSFFPMDSMLASLIGSYAIFAVGYVVRPIGGVVFSHFGDTIGRKKTFTWTVCLMGLATFLMAIMPTYDQIGITATIAFSLCRMLQGLALGGELPGAITLICEYSHESKGYACAWLVFIVNVGIFLAQLIQFTLSHALSPEQFDLYAWRLAFLFGSLLAIISYQLRSRLTETDDFMSRKVKTSFPLKLLFQHHSKAVMCGILSTALSAALVAVYLHFLIIYLQVVLNMTPAKAGHMALIQLVVLTLFSSFWSYLSDHINRARLLLFGAIYSVVGSYVFFTSLQLDGLPELFIMAINIAFVSIFLGVIFSFLFELFPVEVRYSGIAVSYNVAYAIIGGGIPLLSTYLIKQYHMPMAPAHIIAIVAIPAVLAISWQLYKKPQA